MTEAKRGFAYPFGATATNNGVNFSFYAPFAIRLLLHLFDNQGQLLEIIELDPKIHRTGKVWHIELPFHHSSLQYGWEIYNQKDLKCLKESFNHLILDPFSQAIKAPKKWRTDEEYQPISIFQRNKEFEWEEDRPLNLPLKELILYEVHVRAFTRDPSSHVEHPGTFLGLIEKIPYLKELGINAIELLPIFEFNEGEWELINPNTQEILCNFWGYSTVQFFTPHTRFGSVNPHVEFKQLVKQCHRANIEVLLDVVYNHTAEGGSIGPVYSLKAIDPRTFYHITDSGIWENYSGCGNTLHANHPIVIEWIVTSLRHWVQEYHVDGFRFDLASILTRGENGVPLTDPPLIKAITQDPVLAQVKLIAEAWDAGGLYQVGEFYNHSSRWSEWNGQWRDSIRKFIRGASGKKGNFATRISGSEDLYYNRSPLSSINFVTCHDGFTLNDLVSYNEKHNLNNAENNRDGTNDNQSWNCGVEGPTDDPEICTLRMKQMKNFIVSLMIAQGVPMLLSGDEYGHTKMGNNNTWCHDNTLNWFLWNRLEQEQELFQFWKGMIALRRTSPHFKKGYFLSDKDITWYGTTTDKPQWNLENHFVAFVLKDETDPYHFYVAFNASHKKITVTLPKTKQVWQWCVNTAGKPPMDFFPIPTGPLLITTTYTLAPYSAIILKETLKA